MRRVNVKGTSGSGKTTFARELAERLGVPYIELDALHHGPDWYQPTAEEFRARVVEAMAQLPDGWVIDGNYEAQARRHRARQPPTRSSGSTCRSALKLRRVARRTRERIRDDVELWNGNKETWRDALWGRGLALLVDAPRTLPPSPHVAPRYADDPRFVRLRSVEEARAWLDSTS